MLPHQFNCSKLVIRSTLLRAETNPVSSLRIVKVPTWKNQNQILEQVYRGEEVMKVEQVQTKFLKMILGLPSSTPTAALYMELGVWPVRERLEYLTFMLYQDLARRKEGVASSIVQSDEMKQFPNFIVERAKRTMIGLGKTSFDPRSKDKQEWAKILRKGLLKRIEIRLKAEMDGKTKSRFIVNRKFKRKGYIFKETGNTALQILRIRLNMFPTKSNFKANQESFACPKCSSQDDTTEHVVECYTGLKSKELRRFDTKIGKRS